MLIRSVDPRCADALDLLHEAVVDARALYPELFEGRTAQATNAAFAEGDLYLLAYVNDKALASGAFRALEPLTAEVRRMYVHRDHRRQGLASQVLRALTVQAQLRGYSRLVLETGHKQLPAMRLYESFGFERIPAFGAHADDPGSICYALNLAPAH
jgi:GNAT superfamily N-acetyltransferase